MVVELARDLIRTQDQLGPRDNLNLVFKLFNERLPKVYGTVKEETQSIGHAFTVGHSVNGIVGTANGIDGQQLTIGTGGLGAATVERVISFDNTFVEPLRDTAYIDGSNTTASIDTTSNTITF